MDPEIENVYLIIDEARELEAGRVLDRRILQILGENPDRYGNVPNYSADLAVAMTAVVRLNLKGRYFILECGAGGGAWRANFFWCSPQTAAEAPFHQPALAICRAIIVASAWEKRYRGV